MTHLAIWLATDQCSEVEWGDLVTNEGYEIPGGRAAKPPTVRRGVPGHRFASQVRPMWWRRCGGSLIGPRESPARRGPAAA